MQRIDGKPTKDFVLRNDIDGDGKVTLKEMFMSNILGLHDTNRMNNTMRRQEKIMEKAMEDGWMSRAEAKSILDINGDGKIGNTRAERMQMQMLGASSSGEAIAALADKYNDIDGDMADVNKLTQRNEKMTDKAMDDGWMTRSEARNILDIDGDGVIGSTFAEQLQMKVLGAKTGAQAIATLRSRYNDDDYLA